MIKYQFGTCIKLTVFPNELKIELDNTSLHTVLTINLDKFGLVKSICNHPRDEQGEHKLQRSYRDLNSDYRIQSPKC